MPKVTEEEARAKWCPMAFNSENSVHCTGRTCMCFEEAGTRYEADEEGEEGEVQLYRCGLSRGPR